MRIRTMPMNKPFLKTKKRSYMDRRINQIPIKQRFLIVCEGEKTEPLYFEGFRVPGLVAEVIGLGMVCSSLVNRAIELKEQGDYDQCWCVFDKDDNSNEEFYCAISLAKKNGMKVAYSNQCFELWYVLHFDYMANSITRSDYRKILDKKLGHEYEKKSTTTYQELRQFQVAAIRNAENLLREYPITKAAENDPSTTVHLLVKELNKYSSN